jgi:hypothetical protein
LSVFPHASALAQNGVVRAMNFPMGEGVFDAPAGWEPPGRSISYLEQLNTSVTSQQGKFTEIASGVSPSQYGEVAALVLPFFFFCRINFKR